VLQSQAGQSAEDKQLSLQTAIQAHYSAVFTAASECQKALQTTLGRKLPLIATGHLTTVGASTSESVREIYVGALEAFPTSGLPPGRLHCAGAHTPATKLVGGLENIRYCGSPTAAQFRRGQTAEGSVARRPRTPEGSEGGHRALPVPRFQGLAWRSVATSSTLPAADWRSGRPEGTREHFPTWLEVTVARRRLYGRPAGTRIRGARLKGWPVEVLRIRRQRGNADGSASQPKRCETLDELSPYEVFARRLATGRTGRRLAAGAERALSRHRQRTAGGSQMKILSLRLKNLNSLKGEWHIDFTQAAFCRQLPVRHHRPDRRRQIDAARRHLSRALSPDAAPENHFSRRQRHHDAAHRRLSGRGRIRGQRRRLPRLLEPAPRP
jgi:hypothetical protein